MPLTTPTNYICDGCGGMIEPGGQGFVEWLTDLDGLHHGFRIIHVGSEHGSCRAYRRRAEGKLVALERLTGPDGLAFALSLLHPGALHEDPGSRGAKNAAEFAHFLRRLFLPYYEEASRFFDRVVADGLHQEVGDTDFYTEANLQCVLRRYRR